MNQNELKHFGVLGMHWGVRRGKRSTSGNARDELDKKIVETRLKKATTEDRTLEERKKRSPEVMRIKEGKAATLKVLSSPAGEKPIRIVVKQKSHAGQKIVAGLILAGALSLPLLAYK